MRQKRKFGLVLVALALLSLPVVSLASAVVPPVAGGFAVDAGGAVASSVSRAGDGDSAAGGRSWLLWLAGLAVIAGTVTVTYAYPVAGTTAPTATQASTQPTVTATINWAEADTTGLITHNFGLQTQTYTPNTGQLFPEIIWYCVAGQTVAPAVTFALTSGNVITFGKTSAVGTGGTIVVIVRRPNTAEL